MADEPKESEPVGTPVLGDNPNSQGTRPATLSRRSKFNPLTLVLLLSAFFFVCFILISGAFYLCRVPTNNASGKSSSGFLAGMVWMSGQGGAVGIVEINGVILDSKRTLKKLEELEEDPDVKAIILRLNSPGGGVAPSQEIYEAVKKLKKPVFSSMASLAASGAYYVACATQRIFANQGTLTGSIGTIMSFANLEKLYEWAKVKRFVIKSGKFKDVGSEFREMRPEERELLQAMINDVLLQFKTAVSEGRKIPMDELSEIADGRIFSGTQAKNLNLVDDLGTLQDAIEAAAVVGKIKGKPRLVYPEKRRRKWLDLILDDFETEEESSVHVESEPRGFTLLRRIGEAVGLSFGSGLGVASLGSDSRLNPGIYWIWDPH